jgi:hypothetical protein
VVWAKVLVAAIAALHEAKVVHADLKPANAYLIKDPTIAAEYQLKLIDMDFSVLADRRPPWHGHQGYVGTDNYRSPEHLARGSVPLLASDVFTCGLILYELLTGRHPYWSDDQSEYARQVQTYRATPPALLGPMPWPASNADVSSVLHRCLSPEPAARPTAAELRAVLSGRDRKPTAAPAVTAGTVAAGAPRPRAAPATAAGAKAPAAAAAAAASGPPLTADAVQLLAPGGKSLRIGVRTALGKMLVRQLGPEAEFWDEQQCVIERNPAGQWSVAPVGATTNQTLVNGRALKVTRVLSPGDRIAVGNEAKGVAKLPLTVRAA